MNAKLAIWLSLCALLLLIFLILCRLQKHIPKVVKEQIKYEKYVQKKAQEFKEAFNSATKTTNNSSFPWEKNTTIIIKTLFRPSCLLRLLKSIRKYYHSVPIIIVDDSTAPLIEDGEIGSNITYKYITFDSGASLGRNIAVGLAKTEYILLLDDDFVFTDKTKIETLFDFLSSHADFDLVCGGVSDRGLFTGLFYETKDGYDVKSDPKNPIGGQLFYTKKISDSFYETHRGVNFFLARKKVLEEVPWDNDLKTGEHTEHFFRMFLKKKKIAVNTDVIADHDGGKNCSDNFEYMTLRGRNFGNFIFLKHNITSFCGIEMSEKQRKFHRVLKEMITLAKEFPLQLTCGTALGFHREGGFIEHDDDIDLFLPLDDGDEGSVAPIITAVSPAFDVWALRGNELSFIHKKEKVRVDIFFLRNGYKHKWYSTYAGPQYDREVQWKLPMYKPDEITIFGQKYSILPKWVLPFIYGASWSIPKVYTYDEYIKEPTGIYRLDDTPIPVPKETFINDFFENSVYVINLDNRPDKMSRVDEILKGLGIKYNRFSAKIGVPLCKKLTKGEIGCLWSHVSIWKKALAEGAPWTLVLEDDPEFPENVTQSDFGEVMLEASVGNRDPQFILFGHCFSKGKFLPTIHNKILLKQGSAECTHCYAISLEAIKRLLPEVERQLCQLPIDTIAAKYYEKRSGNGRGGSGMYMAYSIKSLKGVEKDTVYGEGIVMQQRIFKSDVADRTRDKTKGKARD